MPAIQTVCIALLLTVVLLFDKCFGYPSIRQRPVGRPGGGSCSSCGDACNKCEFGVVTLPHCGRVCAKVSHRKVTLNFVNKFRWQSELRFYPQGPNQICGGHADVWGVCGDGMFCNCNRCDGCSTNKLNCTMKKPCLPGNSKSSFLNTLERYIPITK
ncbi:queen brain-selective protein-1 isoform X1 [Andrena cerasifolii]|uniref:queen brain-selective protein-1 isoform X1 n=1 Tax=Andrena cerasifolii TaxID=2819439 RepID=UPI004037C163